MRKFQKWTNGLFGSNSSLRMTEGKSGHSGLDPESIMSSLGLTRGSSRNKAFHSAGYPMGMTGEGGRSMVEMLGVLAVMAVIGMVGVKMYTNAMHKHRANELIYEAQKRATMVAMQITAGQENLSITGFKDPAVIRPYVPLDTRWV